MKKNIIITVLTILLFASNYLNFKRIAADAISFLPPDMACSLSITFLQDADEIVARNAADSLRILEVCEADDPLLGAIDHYDANVRHNALNALSCTGKSSIALDSAIAILSDPCEEPFVISSAISLIEKVQDPGEKNKAINALKLFLNSDYEYNKVLTKDAIETLSGNKKKENKI